MKWPERRNVLVLGSRDFDEQEFVQRSLFLVKAADIESVKDRQLLNEACAVIVAEPRGKYEFIQRCYTELFPYVQDRGLAVAALSQNLHDHSQIEGIRGDIDESAPSWVFKAEELWRAAEYIARHEPGPPEGTPKFEPAMVVLTEEQQLLLSRAFWDCSRLYLKALHGGMANEGVFQIQAWFADYEEMRQRPRPLPFVVKIANLKDSALEELNYLDFVEHYLPFNLRPQLMGARCVSTRARRAMVGSFVDHSVDLRKALRWGQGNGLLFSLFETSLRGFRAQPLIGTPVLWPGELKNFVNARVQLAEWDASARERVEIARSEFGLGDDPEAIVERLLARGQELECLIGPTHGDLNCGNVMVRGGDAIVIDFASIRPGPLPSDPATLEVSLMFGTDDEDKPDAFASWRSFIDEIYGREAVSLHPPALFESQPGEYSWLRRSLREVRHILLACNGDEDEAKIVLAAYFLRFVRLPIERIDDKLHVLAQKRHAYALVIADRLSKSLKPVRPTTAQ